MKKLTALLLVVVLAITATVSGTMAYLQDTDEAVNVMTLGNVTIAQHEYERVTKDGAYVTDTIDGKTSYVLQDFTQAKPLYPIVGDPNEPGNSPAYAGWDNTTVRMSQVDSYGGMQVFAGKNAQDKFVTVENTGKSDAYVRTIVAIEIGTSTEKLIGKSSRTGDGAPWIEEELNSVVVINGNTYRVFEFLYRGAEDVQRHVGGILPAGETTYPSLCQVYLKHNAKNEDMVAIDGNGNGHLDILVLSQAIQTMGFDNAEQALNTGFGEFNADNVKVWFEAEVEMPVVTDDDDSVKDALAAGKDVILTDDLVSASTLSNGNGSSALVVKAGQTLDGGNNDVAAPGANTTWASAICARGGTIKDLNVVQGFRGIMIYQATEQVVLENVTIEGPTYTISCDSSKGNGLVAYNSTFNGWTSYAASIGDVEFYGCSFGAGAGYNFSRPYAPTTYVNCDFAAGHRIDARGVVTFENCTINGVALTADNLATLVTSRIENATIIK